ncbi:hypothetical protein GOODEAATRI_024203 [Goodea atripinnis]|uniref:ATP-dependent RNA helicase n=1 Tax=Goodea atripinnis TaxID=208336 RepID=A0ABV0PR98_9TELE
MQTDLTSSNIASHLSLSPAQMPLQKLLFSATLTQNPEKLQQLGLYQPQLFSSVHSPSSSTTADPTQKQERFDFPQGLTLELSSCRLISTDAAARGIDINGVKCVVNYDAPQYVRTYIHRVGRTARAGKAGLAFTFLLRVQVHSMIQN